MNVRDFLELRMNECGRDSRTVYV